MYGRQGIGLGFGGTVHYVFNPEKEKRKFVFIYFFNYYFWQSQHPIMTLLMLTSVTDCSWVVLQLKKKKKKNLVLIRSIINVTSNSSSFQKLFHFYLSKLVDTFPWHTFTSEQNTVNTFSTSSAFPQALMSTWAKEWRLLCTPPPGRTLQTRWWLCSTLAPTSTSRTPTTSVLFSWPHLVDERKLC